LNNNQATHKKSKKTKSSIIDLFLASSNLPRHTTEYKVLKKTSSSDHWPIQLTIATSTSKKITMTNWNKLLEHIENNIITTPISTPSELDIHIHSFNQIYIKAKELATFTKIINTNRINLPAEGINLLKTKKRLKNIYKANPTTEVKKEINSLNNKIKKLNNNLRIKKWNSIYASLIKTKPSERTFWLKLKDKDKTLKEPLPNLSINLQEKAEQFANHFEAAFTNNKKLKTTINPDTYFKYYTTIKYNEQITTSELNKAISKLKNTNSQGIDQISNQAIKKFTEPIREHIKHLFNASLNLSYMPTAWKTAKVILLEKKNSDLSQLKSYRPISLLSCLGKTLEKIINTRLTNWTTEKNILIREQAGFRANRSTQDVIFKLIESTKKNLHENKKTGAILFDFEKAFDTIPHTLMLQKLNKLKCPTKLGKWLKSYLANRHLQIHINKDKSNLRPIKAGLPQGGALSALLFAIYINDIGKELHKCKVNFALFADDTSIWTASSNTKTIQKKLQKATNSLHKYTEKWGMKLNATKTNYIIFKKKYKSAFANLNNKLSIKVDNTQIDKCENPTLLGITLDENLNFDIHFKKLTSSLQTKLNLIRTLSSKQYQINPTHLDQIYRAFKNTLQYVTICSVN